MKRMLKLLAAIIVIHVPFTYASICPDVNEIKKNWQTTDVYKVEPYKNNLVVNQISKPYGSHGTFEASVSVKNIWEGRTNAIEEAKAEAKTALETLTFSHGGPSVTGHIVCYYTTANPLIESFALVSGRIKPSVTRPA